MPGGSYPESIHSMYISNQRRDRKYGPPDLGASKEAGMQDKTEYENKVLIITSPYFNAKTNSEVIPCRISVMCCDVQARERNNEGRAVIRYL
jgi:hypothetical protein